MIGVLGAVSALVFWRRLPASRNFRARAATPARIFADTLAIYRDPGLPRFFLVAFLAMGGLSGCTTFSASACSSRPTGWPERDRRDLPALPGRHLASAASGRLAERRGRAQRWADGRGDGRRARAHPGAAAVADHRRRRRVHLGFFAAHALASGWVGRRAGERRALASALYLSSYYLGASVLGSLAGTAWADWRWAGVAALVGCACCSPEPARCGCGDCRRPVRAVRTEGRAGRLSLPPPTRSVVPATKAGSAPPARRRRSAGRRPSAGSERLTQREAAGQRGEQGLAAQHDGGVGRRGWRCATTCRAAPRPPTGCRRRAIDGSARSSV